MCLTAMLTAVHVVLMSSASTSTSIVLDRPAAAYQKPYHPKHATTPTVNPPPLVWVPVTGVGKYAVQLARDKGFAGDAVRTFKDVPWSVLVLDEPLATGSWWWRYGACDKDGKTVWSKARQFTVSDAAQTFPAPAVDALIAKIPRERPRLFVQRSELQRYRELGRSELASVVRRLRGACEKCVGEQLVPEPEYVKGKGAMRGKYYRDIFVRTRPPMNRMEECGLLYLLTGEKRCGLEAKRRICHFFSWDPEGSTNYWKNDEPAMWVMMRGTRAYDWTWDLFTPDERTRVEACMRKRAAQFYQHLRRRKFESNPHESHANRTLGFLGEAALSFAHEWPEAREWLRYVTQVYWGIFPAWGADDGGWQEGPGYWNAYMSFALHFVTALRQITGQNLTDEPFFRNTPYYAIYTNPPYAGHSPFGDGQNGRPGRSRGSLLYWFSTLTRDPYARWYANATKSGPGQNILGVVLRDPTLKAKHPRDLPQARAFPGVGLVGMHSALGEADKDAYLLLRSSPYGGISHGHGNQNAFVVEAFGEPLAIASGYYPWYSSPHHAKWTRQTKAACSITIDGGTGQTVRDRSANGRITHFATGDAFDLAVGDATRAYKKRLKRFLRKVVHVRPGVFVVFDDVVAPKPVTFEWWLHSMSEMQADAATRRVLVRQGDARMDVCMLAPTKIRFAQTDRALPAVEADRPGNWPEQWHLTASTADKTGSTRFLTVLWPWKGRGPGEGAVRSLRHADLSACEVTLADGRAVVAFRTADGPRGRVKLGPIETDAASVAVRFDTTGKATHYVVEDARWLRVGPKTVVEADRPMTQTGTVAG